MKGKFYYLDGLRGLAAFIVVIHHFVLAFYPLYYSTERIIPKTPLNLFYAGILQFVFFLF